MDPPSWVDLRGKTTHRREYDRRELSAVKYLVCHHSAVDVDSSSESIADYHVNTLGWAAIGYHFNLRWGGTIEYCGDIRTARANVKGLNDVVIGVCFPGNWTGRWPWPTQLNAGHRLFRWLQYICPEAEVVGHGQIALPISPTSCPGNTWSQWRGQIS